MDLLFLFISFFHLLLGLMYYKYNIYINIFKDTLRVNLQNIISTFYFIGHILIFISYLLRVDIIYLHSFIVSILGFIGHSFLFIFMVIILYKFKKNKYNILLGKSLLNYLFIIGQFGMLIIYLFEYIYVDYIPYNYNIFYYVIFILLFFYYLLVMIKNYNKKNIMCLPLSGLVIVYILLIYKRYNDIKDKIVNVI